MEKSRREAELSARQEREREKDREREREADRNAVSATFVSFVFPSISSVTQTMHGLSLTLYLLTESLQLLP